MVVKAPDDVREDLGNLIKARIKGLRPKLLDLSRRNPLVSTSLSPRGNSIIRVVDELPEVLAVKLMSQAEMRLVPLPALDADPLDEKSATFQNAFSNARRTDEGYITAVDAIDPKADGSAEALQRLDRELRDRIRHALDMPPRQSGKDISLSQHAKNNGISPSYDLPNRSDAHDDGRHEDTDIQTLFLPEELERKLNALTTKCRTWTQETGINVLHAALGFVEWTEPNTSSSSFAPLLLLPVQIEKKKTKDGVEFWVSSEEEEFETNTVFAEKLRLEFGLNLPTFEGGSLEDYFEAVAQLEPKTLKWRVRRQVAFGVFPSARLAMYNDLDGLANKFEFNKIISSLFGGSDVVGATPFAEDYAVDEPSIEKQVPALVMDADSSQFSTIVDVASGKNVAVEGPPGTGKSQTIVNTIAAAIASGKKVLFVAEKTAALEVVKSRLEMIGLGEFVLPMQAARSGREAVVQSLRERLEMNPGKAPANLPEKVEQFRRSRADLAQYLAIISQPFGASGLTVFEVLGRNIARGHSLDGAPKALQRPVVHNVAQVTQSDLSRLREAGGQLEEASEEAYALSQRWEGLAVKHIDRFTIDDLLEDAGKSAEALAQLTASRKQLAGLAPENTPVASLEKMASLLESANEQLRVVDVELLVRLFRSRDLPGLFQFLAECEAVQNQRAELSGLVEGFDDPTTPEKLRALADHCEEMKLKTPDPAGPRDTLKRIQAVFDSKMKVYRALHPFMKSASSCMRCSSDQLINARKIVQSAGAAILDLRNEDTSRAKAASVIRQFCTKGRELRAQRQHFAEAFAAVPELDNVQLLAMSGTLRSANFFERFGSKYREARKFYLAHARAGKFDQGRAANDLQALSEWRVAEESYRSHEQAKRIFGPTFASDSTNFDSFERLADFYQAVEEGFPGDVGRGLLVTLKSGSTAVLRSIPDISNLERTHNFSEFVADLKKLQEQIKVLGAQCDKLETLCQGFDSAKSQAIGLLKQFADQFEAYHNQIANLDPTKVAEQLLGAKFEGANTRASEISRELGLAQKMLGLGQFADVVIQLVENGKLDRAIADLKKVVQTEDIFQRAIEALSQRSGINFAAKTADLARDAAVQLLAETSTDRAGLIAHSKLTTARDELTATGGGWAAEALAAEEKSFKGIADLLDASYHRAMAMEIYAWHGNVLAKYPGAKLDELRSQLAVLDREIISLSRQALREKLYREASPPSGRGTGRKSEWTELALINNEISKKQSYIPFRDLTRRAFNALVELKPCWMMSPLAVAQYLPAGQLQFELCIIDEASQMPPEDAVGALVRCDKAMIVGDTNQLPPSNFFKKSFEDEDADEDEAVEEESILELANGAFRPARRLRWHYRSRHSSLIQFSNHHVYGGDLVVFPGAIEQREGMGVSLVSVDGRYKTGLNPKEATVMVAAALEFMRKNPDRSLGIVTLNQKQRDLIDEEWNHAVAKDPVAAAYVEKWEAKSDGIERFFIKNLENVQGDERDVIFIGTVYGAETAGGPVMQRFGPINGLSGKRRLNVLFSRAKEQIVTFSSMTAADISADENGNVGAFMLKRWLEYSATGKIHAGDTTNKAADSDFEIYVMDQLRAMGCEPVPQVGAAGYFIDIGVKHPSWPHGYILAVECDGATYHSSRSARDRDRLRQQVLEGLGWEFHRIWSTDWFNDPRREGERLREVVARRLEALKRTI